MQTVPSLPPWLGFITRVRSIGVLLAGVIGLATFHRADAILLTTYVTGETSPGEPGEEHVIFTVTFDPAVAYSGVVTPTITDAVHRLDGIDFVPGTSEMEVVAAGTFLVGADGFVGHYNVFTGSILPDYIASTKVAVPPLLTATHPSSVKATATHFYYTENQFGFEASDPHRIIRKPFAGGPAELVFDGAVAGLVEFEGLEIVGSRLYFFARDPGDSTKRALMSIGLSGGVWDTVAPAVELAGLGRGAPAGIGPGSSDGSDELDYDPVTGLIWGSNIATGELIAYDPVADVGAVVVSAAAVAGGTPTGLGLLGKTIDGIRSTSEGHLVFAGLEGVIGSIDLSGFIVGGGLGAGSILDADVFPLVFGAPGEYAFDDLTPLAVAVPEPSAFLLVLGALAAWRFRRR